MSFTRIWFYVANGGDGSALLQVCESKELAELMDENQDEGWGESSADYIDVDGKTMVITPVVTVADEIDYALGWLHADKDNAKMAEYLKALQKIQRMERLKCL